MIVTYYYIDTSFQMLEACTSQEDADDETDLKEILNKARDHLNSSKFDDAEAAFLKLYQQIQVSVGDRTHLKVLLRVFLNTRY